MNLNIDSLSLKAPQLAEMHLLMSTPTCKSDTCSYRFISGPRFPGSRDRTHVEGDGRHVLFFCLRAEPNGSKRCRLVIIEGVQKRS